MRDMRRIRCDRGNKAARAYSKLPWVGWSCVKMRGAQVAAAAAAEAHLDRLHQAHPLIHCELMSAKLAPSHEPAI